MNTRRTNIEAVVDLMEYSQFGALAQIFVVDALGKQAKRVADAPEEAFAGMKDGMIHPKAWQGVAREIEKKLDAHLGCSNRVSRGQEHAQAANAGTTAARVGDPDPTRTTSLTGCPGKSKTGKSSSRTFRG